MDFDYSYINKINSPDDLKRICFDNPQTINTISTELRRLIIEVVTQNGGHLASSLGVVEITLALHLMFNAPKDTIIFDVGHQCYAHKILTGRYEQFYTLRQANGISGFPKREESIYDAFNTGHSSTSVSAALGVARAKIINGDKSHTGAVIGDGSITGGMSFEALNDVGQSKIPIIVILNDNEMAISGTVGALGAYLSKLRTSHCYISFKQNTVNFINNIPLIGKSVFRFAERLKNKIKFFLIPDVMFESMGLAYIGPIDGHDIKALEKAFTIAKKSERPIIIHAVTKKGKGYLPAETDSEKYHGISGKTARKKALTNSKIVGETLIELANKDKSIVAVTAAMPTGTGLSKFGELFPERFFDVGIAEQHAVTMAAGMATQGIKPIVAVYSTFLQRAYDQILHDVCLQRLPVVFGIDRAGLVGDDGETHQGVYDIAYLLTMPSLVIASPSTTSELREMISLCFTLNCPCAIRYNRGCLPDTNHINPVVFGKWEIISALCDVNIVATGRMVQTAVNLSEKYHIGVVNARFISPMDFDTLLELKKKSKVVITLEDGIVTGGFGAKIAQFYSRDNIKVYNKVVISIPIHQGTVEQQDKLCGLDYETLALWIEKLLKINFR